MTAGCLLLWRLLSQVPIVYISGRFIFLRSGLLSLNPPGFFSSIGAGSLPFERYSVGNLGIAPYVTALVIVSLVAAISSRARAVSLARWTAGVALILAFAAAWEWTMLIQSTQVLPQDLDAVSRSIVCLELTGGTALTIFIAQTIDEHGYGFGYGAVLLFALGASIDQLHRLADYLAVLSVERVYAPAFVWAGVWIAVAGLTVGMLLAFRRLSLPDAGKRRRPVTLEMRFLTPGVLRPPQFTFAVLSLPAILARYYPPTSGIAILTHDLSPYGVNLWAAALLVAVELSLIVFFAWFVAAYDWRLMTAAASLRPHAIRLALLSGAGLALVIVGAPIADHILTTRVGQLIPLSAADTVLIVAVVLFIVRAIEGHRATAPYQASPSGLP